MTATVHTTTPAQRIAGLEARLPGIMAALHGTRSACTRCPSAENERAVGRVELELDDVLDRILKERSR